MHPIEKIIVLIAVCQAIQTAYLVAHVHDLHGSSRAWYLLKMAPLIVVTIWLLVLVLRILQVVPYFGLI